LFWVFLYLNDCNDVTHVIMSMNSSCDNRYHCIKKYNIIYL